MNTSIAQIGAKIIQALTPNHPGRSESIFLSQQIVA
jgi:hypothetical protein